MNLRRNACDTDEKVERSSGSLKFSTEHRSDACTASKIDLGSRKPLNR